MQGMGPGAMHRGDGPPPGAGVDGARPMRPGVPRERRETALPDVDREEPARQPGADALGRTGLRVRTPVFGTAQPVRGASGALRRAAYRIPEHRAGRWALLLAADRVDVLEHRLRRAGWALPALAALAAGYLVASRALRRR
ncbi:hypothetical protein AnaeK_2539 [Anaeromyxobacter sp. K]|uniref:Uncharacterized protein n=2 Tax=Anaeromyxobacteraceae TaxID=1524215 RepID=B8JDC3_ANAD2|nr:hypothetical protein AnaeK_2539 [Anaeromyxobacter sp. K]ACL65972.1 conserved hypothetical protein [Anaeromyxobacter dehalogenans 2CP-1]